MRCMRCIELYEIDELFANEVRNAITVFEGQALCHHHLDWVRGIITGPRQHLAERDGT